MGPGDKASEKAKSMAYDLGKLIAKEGWVTVSGGRNSGVMEEVNKGAKSENGLTVGIIPGNDNSNTSESVDISIVTGMGSARNNINILTCDTLVIVTESMGAGTASEATLALKSKKKIILLSPDEVTKNFFEKLSKDLVYTTITADETIRLIKKFL